MSPSVQSRTLFERARKVIPGGVNSPVRAFRAVGGEPRFIRSARGCYLEDVEGRRYIDYVGSWGPMILGHAHPEVVQAVQRAAADGTSYGAPTEAEVLLAETVCRIVPGVEQIRLVNSGTEATLSALRLARAFTGRPLFIKFDGCYHGHGDSFLVQAGSGVATLGLADSPGVPPEFSRLTLSLPFNDLPSLEQAFERYGEQLAALILEPVPGNMGVVLPRREFLDGLFRLAQRYGTLVLFDEVMTGFRLALGGAQEYFSLQAPLTCLGKILGGGLPIGAYGGAREVMSQVAPEGPVYQAGTLSGNPLAVAAGLTTLRILERERPYAELEANTRYLCQGIARQAEEAGIPLQVQSCGSMFTLFFQGGPVEDFASAQRSDTARFASFFRKMLDRGIYFAPSQFEACFLSTAHTREALDQTIETAGRVFKEMASEGK